MLLSHRSDLSITLIIMQNRPYMKDVIDIYIANITHLHVVL